MVPDTVQQLTILLVLVLPGVFYQAVRERLRGVLPAEREPQNRLMRAIAVGVILDGVYAVIAGPWLVRVITGGPGGSGSAGGSAFGGLARHPRAAGLAALLLVVAVPAGVAWAEATWTARRLRARYDPAPTAWDALFRDRGSCFVRIRTKSGLWVGGWLGSRSAVSAYPNDADIYLQSQYRMRADGTFVARVPGSAGVYLRGADIEVIEMLEPPARASAPVPASVPRSAGDGADSTRGTAGSTGRIGEADGAAAATPD
jgi:hypothetical protein